MATRVEIIGVYQVDSVEPCHLVELWVRTPVEPFDCGQFTQANPLQPPENWQVAYDEKLLDESGVSIIAGDCFEMRTNKDLWKGDVRIVFFLHYLNPSLPLMTPFGDVRLPPPAEMPERLRIVKYESPC